MGTCPSAGIMRRAPTRPKVDGLQCSQGDGNIMFISLSVVRIITTLKKPPARNNQLLPKPYKSPPDHPQNIPIFWNKDSFNGPGQSRGNITPTSAPPTGFEPQLYIFYLNLFAPSAAPRGTISYSCITEIVPKLFLLHFLPNFRSNFIIYF